MLSPFDDRTESEPPSADTSPKGRVTGGQDSWAPVAPAPKNSYGHSQQKHTEHAPGPVPPQPLALSMPLPMLSEPSLLSPFDYRTESEPSLVAPLDHGRLSPTSSVTASVWKYPLEKSIPKPPNPPPSYADIFPTISRAQPSSGAPPPSYADLLPSILGLRERD